MKRTWTIIGVSDVTRSFTLAVTDVNEAPTAIGFANEITLAENPSTGVLISVVELSRDRVRKLWPGEPDVTRSPEARSDTIGR